MASSLPREEVARRGDEIYAHQIRAKVEAGNRGKVIAIDIDSGDYQIDRTALAASKLLRAKKPDAVIYCVRIGERVLHRIGARPKRVTP